MRNRIVEGKPQWDFTDDEWFGKKKVGSRQSIGLQRLGLGRRYSLDYADEQDLESVINYSSKIAYATKPFKAPKSKTAEVRDFLLGLDGKEPRLARPFGDAIKGDGLQDFLTWQQRQERKETQKEVQARRRLWHLRDLHVGELQRWNQQFEL